MTTARDLAIVVLDVAADKPVEQGDLSLVLAGAEVLDLLDAHALALDGDRILPLAQSPTGDRLLDEAAEALVRQEPYESVEDWLWRRGRGLSAAYVDDLERIGLTARFTGPPDPPADRADGTGGLAGQAAGRGAPDGGRTRPRRPGVRRRDR